jgi:distribution and morphology protein 34
MRPEGIPNKSAYASFRRLWAPSRGLADLAEESIDGISEEGADDDIDYSERRSDAWGTESILDSGIDDENFPPQYEVIPGVGGGTDTRPRVYRAQSTVGSAPRVATPFVTSSRGFSAISPPAVSRVGSRYFPSVQSPPRRQWIGTGGCEMDMELGASARTYTPDYHRANSSAPGPSRPRYTRALQSGRSVRDHNAYEYSGMPLDISHEFAGHSPESSFISRSSSGAVTHPTLSTPPSSEPLPPDLEHDSDEEMTPGVFVHSSQRHRKPSISMSAVHPFHAYYPTSPSDFDPLDALQHLSHQQHELDASASHQRLRPGLNSTAHLSTLSFSNHTLSPFTRTGSVEHFAVRSGLGMGLAHANGHNGRFASSVSASGLGRSSKSALTAAAAAAEQPRVPVKARRKRTIHVGGGSSGKSSESRLPGDAPFRSRRGTRLDPVDVGDDESVVYSASPPPSELEFEFSEEVNHYFASNTSAIPGLGGTAGDGGGSPSVMSRDRHRDLSSPTTIPGVRRRASGTSFHL